MGDQQRVSTRAFFKWQVHFPTFQLAVGHACDSLASQGYARETCASQQAVLFL